MAERALLARARTDGSYAVATARWGGTDSALAAAAAGTPATVLPGVEWTTRQHRPDFRAVVAALDVLGIEVCYHVASGETTVFLPLWFGLPLPVSRAVPTVGALVAVESLADARTLRQQFRSLKGTLTDAATAGAVPWAAVPQTLVAAVAALDTERYLSLPGTAERLYPKPGPDRM